MKKALAFLTTVIFVASLAGGTAVAATKSGGKRAMHGQHTMSGTVSTVDHQTGMVSLNTDAGELKLHFPPQSLQNVKEGDTLTVSLAFHEGAAMKGMAH
jgi:hypothetical protein